MSLAVYDQPNGSYTSSIPPGTRAFRAVVAKHWGFTRHEVVRDQSRCARQRSEHCECRGIDFFTVQFQVGRPLFDWCVEVSEPLGVESVIFQHRQIGFGNPVERHRAKADHMDHVHVGLNRWAAKNLTQAMVEALLPEGDWLMALTEAEQKELLDKTRENNDYLKAIFSKDDEFTKRVTGRGQSVSNALEERESEHKEILKAVATLQAPGSGNGGTG